MPDADFREDVVNPVNEQNADERIFGVIAGSGFQSLAESSSGRIVSTEFGTPSSALRELAFEGRAAWLLLRHGDDLLIPPHCINYRANLKALALCGVTDVISLNTVGVISPGLLPGDLSVPDQIIDYTHGRGHSIYGAESATLDHIDFTDPLNARIRQELLAAAGEAGIDCHDGGVYAVTQGPRLESAAEVGRLERDGADLVGMTAMPEASLAMEMGIRYACLSLIVNHAAGRGKKSIHEDVLESTVSAKAKAMKLLEQFFRRLS